MFVAILLLLVIKDICALKKIEVSLSKLALQKFSWSWKSTFFFPFQRQNDSCAFENITVSLFKLALLKLSSPWKNYFVSFSGTKRVQGKM